MPVQAAAQVLRAASFNGSRGGHDLALLGFGGESGGFGFLCHGLASFWFCDPSDRGRRKQGRCHEAGRHTPTREPCSCIAIGNDRGFVPTAFNSLQEPLKLPAREVFSVIHRRPALSMPLRCRGHHAAAARSERPLGWADRR